MLTDLSELGCHRTVLAPEHLATRPSHVQNARVQEAYQAACLLVLHKTVDL